MEPKNNKNQNQITMQVVLALLEVTKTLGTIASAENLNAQVKMKAERTLGTVLDIIDFEMADLSKVQREAEKEKTATIHRV